jgi:Tfp pilus assembly protein PilF
MKRGALAFALTRAFALALGLGSVAPAAPDDRPCAADAAALARRAEEILGDTTPPDAPAGALDAARDALRRALLEERSPLLLLRAADAADLAGDGDEAAALLEEAARLTPELLSPSERLALARREEARGARRRAIHEYAAALTALARRGAPFPAFIGERIRRLDLEEEAGTLPLRAVRPPTPEARAAFLDAKARLEEGKREAARAGFRKALRLSPGYVEAALALGSLEARSGRMPEAVAALRTALAADPERFEALLSLANVLWTEPDRQAKEESLTLLDRAAALRPDLPSLLKESARRWADWGDATRALDRLRAYDAKAHGAGGDRDLDALRARLAQTERRAEALEPRLPDLESAALAPYRLAQAYARRGDPASRAAALELAREAEAKDPSFAGAPELEATLLEQAGDAGGAEDALRRALAADPSRAGTHERLAGLLAQRGDAAGAARAWEADERAGSREALFALAEEAAKSGSSRRARELYRRSLETAPDGPHAEEARRALARLDRTRSLAEGAALAAAAALTAVLVLVAVRRRSGLSLTELLRKEPAAARDLKGPVGRLRHEVFKHGGLFLRDAAARLAQEDAARETAGLLLSRLFGSPGGEARGIVVETERALAEIEAVARARGARLNLRFRDPLLSPVYRALAVLRRARAPLEKLALCEGAPKARAGRAPKARAAASASVTGALRLLDPKEGAALGALLDDAASTRVELAALEALLAEASRARGVVERVPLVALGLLAGGSAMPRVRVERGAWETIWRNLFANALAAGVPGRPPSLAVAASEVRDPVTGQRILRLVLADDVARPLTTEMIRGRAAERGLGIVADLVRLHEGTVEVGPPPAPGFVKGIVLELPALEEGA